MGIRDNATHVSEMATHGIEAIDMVVANLYPFTDTVRPQPSTDRCAA